MDKIYSIAFSARNSDGITITNAATVRSSLDEARGAALRIALEHLPEEDGYFDHKINVGEVPQDWYILNEKYFRDIER